MTGPAPEPRFLRQLEELSQKAELFCQHELLTAPALSRLPERYAPSELIRGEDLAFVAREPSRVPRSELDRPGLHAALARFSQCRAYGALLWGDQAVVYVTKTRPRWEEPGLLTPEVLTPATPAQRLIALVRWTRRHPETVTEKGVLRFQRTSEGWRADYQLPEDEERRTHPLEVRQCPAVREGPAVRRWEPEMTRPGLLSGSMPRYSAEAFEARVQGLYTARCRLTREGEARDCCVLKSLPHLEAEGVLRALSRMRFAPVTSEGQPLEVEYDFHFRFALPRDPGPYNTAYVVKLALDGPQ
ncbi:energy transducer TonB [Archangium gephyra]|uniref:energy transducer TonB n=1 Tax=Archangium gephyra TaxID=48 RepID=UPI0035D44AAD